MFLEFVNLIPLFWQEALPQQRLILGSTQALSKIRPVINF